MPWLGLLLAALAGAMQAVSLAWPWGVSQAPASVTWQSMGWLQPGQPQPLLQLLALAVLVQLLRVSPTGRRAAITGWVFATAWLAGTFWWLYVSMHTYGGLAAPLAALAVAALAAFLAMFYAVICRLFWSVSHYPYWFFALVFSSLWTGAELLRAVVFTGFPWGAIGYAHVNNLGWVAPWVGVYGVGALVAVTAALVANARTWAGAVVAGIAVLAVLQGGDRWAAGEHITQPHGELRVVLLQGNIAQDEKFESASGVPQALDWYSQRLAQDAAAGRFAAPAPATLVVAPETALPLLPQQLGAPFWQALLTPLASGSHAVLMGLPLGNSAQGYANGAWGLTPQSAQAALPALGVLYAEPAAQQAAAARAHPIYRYEKHHLVPFGEFVPSYFRWFVDLMHIPLGDFNRGALGQPPMAWGGQLVAPNICYEDLFGEELARGFANPATAPTVLVNLSNIGWFGNTVAIDQHVHISRMRALELGRPMVRATNTGATVVINHLGVVTHALARHTAGELVATVQGRTGLTPFARWASAWGLWPVAVAALVLGGLGVLGAWLGLRWRAPQAR